MLHLVLALDFPGYSSSAVQMKMMLVVILLSRFLYFPQRKLTSTDSQYKEEIDFKTVLLLDYVLNISSNTCKIFVGFFVYLLNNLLFFVIVCLIDLSLFVYIYIMGVQGIISNAHILSKELSCLP